VTASLVYPYRVLVGDEILVNAKSRDLAERPDGSWDAQAAEDSVALQVEVQIDIGRLKECLPTSESPEVCDLLIVAQSVTSRRRECLVRHPVRRTMAFELELEKKRHRGELNLYVKVVRRSDCSERPAAIAFSSGDFLGEASPIRIHFDEPASAPGAGMRIEWSDFATDTRLERQADHIFALEDQEPPLILLNAGIPRLYEILSSKGAHGRNARVRDAVYMQIVHQVWTSLLGDAISAVHKALNDLHEAGEVAEVDQTFDEVGGWRAAVLRDWAPALIGVADKGQAAEQLLERVGDGVGSVLLADVPRAIQGKVKTRKAYDGLVLQMGLLAE